MTQTRIESDDMKAWIVGRVPPHVFNLLNELPGRRRYVRGVAYFEPSRSNLEFLDTRLVDAVWAGPAASLVAEFRRMREREKETRALRYEDLPTVEFPFKHKPYGHQNQAFALARGKEAFGYFMEMGCVDKDTEYLSPEGWRNISTYTEGQVAQWNLDGTIEFVEPQGYLVKPCDKMYRFHHGYGCDQKLSPDHRMLLTSDRRPTRKTKYDGWCEYVGKTEDGQWILETTPEKFRKRHEDSKEGASKFRIPCTFSYDGEGIPLTEDQLRLQVAFIADGTYGSSSMDQPPTSTRKAVMRLKKPKKVERLQALLISTETEFREKVKDDGFHVFDFIPPLPYKHFVGSIWWKASSSQKRIISEESLLWDWDGDTFFSTRVEDADFIQFCFASNGFRCSRHDSKSGLLQIHPSKRELFIQTPVEEATEDGLMYCFSVPSTYLVFRRNGNIFISGNTGKTKVTIDDAADIYLNGGDNGKIDTLVIIAPNGVHSQWVTEQVPEHLTDAVQWRGAYTVASPTIEEGRRMRITKEFREGLRVFAIHIDMMSFKKGQQFLQELLLSSKCMLVVDESSRIKDSNSKRTKNLLELGKLAKYRRILTGTPVSQGVEDLYSQFYFLDPNILGFKSFFAFRNRFCRMGGFKGKKIIGYQNEEELKRKIDSYTFRVLKTECLDLPERVYIKQQVPFTDEQKAVYSQMKKDFFLELEGGILTAQMAMTRLIRLQQLIGGFIWKRAKKDPATKLVIEPEMYQEFSNNRVSRTIEIIRESQGKVIVWIKFEGDHRLLTRALNEAGIGFVDYVGTTPKNDRKPNIEKFRNDPDCKVFLSTPKTGGIGLNLTAASEVIWYSRDFSLENELQANDRCHRIGQRNTVTYHYLVTPKTVDERIDKVLASKKSVAENMIDIRDLFDE